uniref:Uncharacterized protein n=1 Tax=Timema poppense TaxID=170557 RepID=A0A7R9CVT7_TIMPO|nr:unnamed protein product [Timema poppensis]
MFQRVVGPEDTTSNQDVKHQYKGDDATTTEHRRKDTVKTSTSFTTQHFYEVLFVLLISQKLFFPCDYGCNLVNRYETAQRKSNTNDEIRYPINEHSNRHGSRPWSLGEQLGSNHPGDRAGTHREEHDKTKCRHDRQGEATKIKIPKFSMQAYQQDHLNAGLHQHPDSESHCESFQPLQGHTVLTRDTTNKYL